MTFVGEAIWEALQYADLAYRGAWPVSGGTLSQTPAFLGFCRTVWAEDAAWRSRKGLPPRA